MAHSVSKKELIPYALAILIGAFLVFQVQPVISKCVLPWFGGTPAVWTTCMLFFQVLLFGGYLYAHFLTSLFSVTRQAWIHGGLLIAAACVLPIQPAETWKPVGTESPTFYLLTLLAMHVGLPYFVLSSTGPLVQKWLSYRTQNKSVYRLYALSNVGSLLALLSYPFVVEPLFSVSEQSWSWSCFFIGYVCILGWLMTNFFRQPIHNQPKVVDLDEDEGGKPMIAAAISWALLSAFASMMLLTITNHVCQDIAVIPFLWVVPLSLYLLSFIICFDRPAWYRPKLYAAALLACLIGWKVFSFLPFLHTLPVEIAYYMLVLFLICMLSHGEVARLKPDPKYLTVYYAFMSGGGALGGIFVGLICPAIFSTHFELIAGFCLTWALGFVVFFSYQGWSKSKFDAAKSKRFSQLSIFLVLVTLTLGASRMSSGSISHRSFFGVLKVLKTEKGTALAHGRTLHGLQLYAPLHQQPTSYYGYESGVGRLLQSLDDQPKSVGVIGLGIGSLANYGRPQDSYDFIEINPDCIHIAQTYFTCLSDSQAAVKTILGDGRLILEQQNKAYDILVLDAFSSDGIPAHLLSVEALKLFDTRLVPDGVIAIHVTNVHLNVAPVVHRLACELGWISREVIAKGSRENSCQDSHWVLLAREEGPLDKELLSIATAPDWDSVQAAPLWTDQYHDLFSILKL